MHVLLILDNLRADFTQNLGKPSIQCNAKRQFDIIGRWVGLRRSPLTLCCNNSYTFSDMENNASRYHRWVAGSKIQRQFLTFCVVTSVWTPPLTIGKYGGPKIQMIIFFRP